MRKPRVHLAYQNLREFYQSFKQLKAKVQLDFPPIKIDVRVLTETKARSCLLNEKSFAMLNQKLSYFQSTILEDYWKSSSL